MSAPLPGTPGRPPDGCAELHAEVTSRCGEAHTARSAHEAVIERVRGLKRELVAAQRVQAEAVASADPRLRAAEKAAARDAYQLARMAARSKPELTEATATWARTVDRVNRIDRLARREVSKANGVLEALATSLREAEREEQLSRIRAEQAEAACLDARMRLATCEEAAQSSTEAPATTARHPGAASTGSPAAVMDGGSRVPLVIVSLVSGDRPALGLAASEIAEHTHLDTVELQLQLQELAEAIRSAAAEAGYLRFDEAHPFWAHLSFEQAHDVVAALARLGFRFEPSEGWHAGRVPTPGDLKVALGYAGIDAFGLRSLPDAEALAQLPHSIGVDARAFLAAQVPELTIDQLARVLGHRAAPLEPLWDVWGQVRRILLSDRRDLGSVPG